MDTGRNDINCGKSYFFFTNVTFRLDSFSVRRRRILVKRGVAQTREEYENRLANVSERSNTHLEESIKIPVKRAGRHGVRMDHSHPRKLPFLLPPSLAEPTPCQIRNLPLPSRSSYTMAENDRGERTHEHIGPFSLLFSRSIIQLRNEAADDD